MPKEVQLPKLTTETILYSMEDVASQKDYGYFLAAVIGLFSAWLATATVDAAKLAMRPTYVPQAITQGER
jgi:hypothetical protein